MDKVTIPLSNPIELKAKDTGQVLVSVAEICLRKPLAGDLMVFDQAAGKMEAMQRLIAKVAGLDFETVKRMEVEDFYRVAEKLKDFLPDGLPTGQPNSP